MKRSSLTSKSKFVYVIGFGPVCHYHRPVISVDDTYGMIAPFNPPHQHCYKCDREAKNEPLAGQGL